MELDDLKPALAAMADRMDSLELDIRQARTDSRLGNARRILRHLGWSQAIVLAMWIGVVATIATFWIEHRDVPHLLVAGIVLHAYGIAAIWVSAVQILLAARTYHTVPVVLFLRRMSELQRFRAISSLALGVPWWILWLLFTIVGARWLVGIDLYERSPLWIQLSLLVGVAGMAVTVWMVRRLEQRPPPAGRGEMRHGLRDTENALPLTETRRETGAFPLSPCLRGPRASVPRRPWGFCHGLRGRGLWRVLDDLAGYKLRRASQELDELARFEAEGGAPHP